MAKGSGTARVMWWPTFDTARRLEVDVVQADYLSSAPMKAGFAGQDGAFQERP